MRSAIVAEIDTDAGKRRCSKRQPQRSRASAEPEDSKGRADAAGSGNGAIKC